MTFPERCPECNKLTEKGLAENRKRFMKNSIFGVDFSKPASVSIEEVRSIISTARGRLKEISYQMPQLEKSLNDVEGALTCCLVTAHRIVKEAQKFELLAEERMRENLENG